MGGSRVLLWAAIVLVAAWFLYSVRSILFPFVIGFTVAALLDPSIRILRKKGFSRTLAVLSLFVSFFAGIGVLAFLVAPIVGGQVSNIQAAVTSLIKSNLFPPTRLEKFLADRKALEIRDDLGDYAYPLDPEGFRKWLTDSSRLNSYYAVFLEEERVPLIEAGLPTRRAELIANLDTPIQPGPIDEMLVRYKPWLQKFNLPTTRTGIEELFQVKKTVNQIASNLFGGAAGIIQYLASSVLLLLLTPLITLFILLDYDNFRRRFVTWIPPAIRPAATDLLGDLGDVLAAYVRGLIKSVALYSTIMALLLTALGVPYSLLLGLIVGVFYLIPAIGYFISIGVIWLALATNTEQTGFLFIDFGNHTTYLVVCLLIFLVVAMAYDQFVHPRIVGKSVGLHPVVSFFVILSAAALFGLPGMILAFPLAGMVKVILDRLIRYTTTSSLDAMDLPRIPKRHSAG
jgi:predicted PurR-regulated permease PerM